MLTLEKSANWCASVWACTKTRNTKTKPSKRNHRITGTKPPKPNHQNETTGTTERVIKTWTKWSRQPQWHHRYWIPGGLSSIIISRIVSPDFPASVVLLSQSLQFPKHKKSEIKRLFYFSIYNSKYVTKNVFPWAHSGHKQRHMKTLEWACLKHEMAK